MITSGSDARARLAGRTLAIVTAVVVAAVAAVGPAVGAAVPGLTVFAATFTGLGQPLAPEPRARGALA